MRDGVLSPLPVPADGEIACQDHLFGCLGASGFPYDELAADDAANVRARSALIKTFHKQESAAAIAIGQELLAVKGLLGRGRFGRWLAAEFMWDARTAERYMSVARAFADDLEIAASLPLTALYLLASRSTPARFRDEVIASLRSGQRVDPARLPDMLRAAKQTVLFEGAPEPQDQGG
ncbi:DUF3102 domain-containing protein [Microvirga sesbaniae]|uniref:DUF3102 domain-containing protein n=1 Tax=Microvirga sesbaniae TaxID=681392 RepID=UPI0021C9BC12|nr:DUF3102 domain-containing protein [Microvirga sp. HBU67692]